ncbi:hypothetical protein [Pseudomonas gingeri]|uniref:hypothetical protein n=1 Tax=Pseudomonas gingeri TaxID=117681 RepID=UPI00159FE0AF|nr:hypothetical protein [Pseudomonas gingeri]NWE48723.1 hypothetical protein [Pseudomonas gingeri]
MSHVKSLIGLGTIALMVAGCTTPVGVSTLSQPKDHWRMQQATFFADPNKLNVRLSRSQGMAYEVKTGDVYFSGNDALEKSNINYDYAASKVKNPAIPTTLVEKFGSNHIGCIDMLDSNGQQRLIAPIEDGKDYDYPVLAQYGLTPEMPYLNYVLFPRTAELDDGIPWVTIDHARNAVYTSKYYYPTHLLITPLNSLPWGGGTAQVSYLPLTGEHLNKVQCAKVKDDYVYALPSDAEDHIKAINLNTGAVTAVTLENYPSDLSTVPGVATPLCKKDSYDPEMQGLAFFPKPDGTTLHATAILRCTTVINSTMTRGIIVFDFKEI